MTDEERIQQQILNQYAMIWNYNAHVEKQFNYYGCKPEEEAGDHEESDDEAVFIDLKFFSAKTFNSLERQAALRSLLEQSVKKINVDAGRDWIVFYIAYHYYEGKLALQKKYVDFFADIEALLPNVLTKVNKDEQGNKRYRAYTDSLPKECDKWFVDNSCLPPLNEWTTKEFHKVDDDRKKMIQELVNEVHKGLKEIK